MTKIQMVYVFGLDFCFIKSIKLTVGNRNNKIPQKSSKLYAIKAMPIAFVRIFPERQSSMRPSSFSYLPVSIFLKDVSFEKKEILNIDIVYAA